MALRILLTLCVLSMLSPIVTKVVAQEEDPRDARIWGMDAAEALPPKDFVGIAGFQFGMSGAEVEARVEELNYKSLPGRAGTLRFRGKLLGRPVDIMAELFEPPTGARAVSRYVLHWDPRESSAGKALEPYLRLRDWLGDRFGPVRKVDEAGQAHLATASGANRRFYERVDSGEQAILELVPLSPGEFQLRLTLSAAVANEKSSATP